MIEYSMEKSEVLLVEMKATVETKDSKNHKVDVVLTSKNIVFIYKNIFNIVKEVKKYRIQDVMIYQGKAAVTYNENAQKDVVVDVTLMNDILRMYIDSFYNKQIKTFINEINRVLCGITIFSTSNMSPEMEEVTESVIGSLEMFRNKMFQNNQICVYCRGCSAQIVGYVGGVYKCPYCNTYNQL